MKRGGVQARNYVLHIHSTAIILFEGGYYRIEASDAPSDKRTRCKRVAACVNCTGTGLYSQDELCRVCLRGT